MVQGPFVCRRRLAACSVLAAVACLYSLPGAGLLCEPAQVSRLLCVCCCCLPLLLALVQGSCVSKCRLAACCGLSLHRSADCYVHAAVACLCGMLGAGLLCEPAHVSCLLCAHLVPGSCVSQRRSAACSVLAAVACPCCLLLGPRVSQHRFAAYFVLAAVACLAACFGAELVCEPAQVNCLLCARSCCLPLWLALVQGTCVSQHRLVACYVLADVACLCGLPWRWALARASTC